MNDRTPIVPVGPLPGVPVAATIYPCPYCPRRFWTERALLAHLVAYHGDET